jgi:hypothetical protein
VLLVLGAEHDASAHALAAACDGLLLTPGDLCRSGWVLAEDPEEDRLVVAGRALPAARVELVVTRLGHVLPEHLPGIRPGDREYVAAEIHATLFFALCRLSCPVLNRPTPVCLHGPNWRQEHWLAAARTLGIATRPLVRRGGEPHAPGGPGGACGGELIGGEVRRVLLVGDAADGPAPLRDCARRLAEHADCPLLEACFHVGAGEDAEMAELVYVSSLPALDRTLIGLLRQVTRSAPEAPA